MTSLDYIRPVHHRPLDYQNLVDMFTSTMKVFCISPAQFSRRMDFISTHSVRDLKRGPPCPLESETKRQRLHDPEMPIWNIHAIDVEDCSALSSEGSSRGGRIILAASFSQSYCCLAAIGPSVQSVLPRRENEVNIQRLVNIERHQCEDRETGLATRHWAADDEERYAMEITSWALCGP